MNSYYRSIAERIKENIGNRSLVVWGDKNSLFEKELFDEYGIKVSFYVFMNKDLCDGKKTKHMSVLIGNKTKYYVINLELLDNKENVAFLKENGFIKTKDYILAGLKSKRVPEGMLGYTDSNGNKCNFCPTNCKIIFKGMNSEVFIHPSTKLKNNLSITIENDCKLEINNRCLLGEGNILLHSGSHVIFDKISYNKIDVVSYDDSLLRIEEKTSIFNAQIRVFHFGRIVIKKDSMISSDVNIWAGDAHSIFDTETGARTNFLQEGGASSKNVIEIGEHVWIGMRSCILAGTYIANGSIVGAGAVVKGRFPNNCVIAGNPAKIVRKNRSWCRDYMEFDIAMCGEDYIKKTMEDTLL